MYKTKIFILSICLYSLSFCTHVSHQNINPVTLLTPKSIELLKEDCSCGNLNGFRYRFVYDSASHLDDSYCNYSNNPIFNASEPLKIELLSNLLKMDNDSSLCCKSVKKYGGKYSNEIPKSASYNLQIDALYHFNFIVFGVYTRQFSPYPVLYDTLTRQEINFDNQKIKEVFGIYKKWFSETSKKGFKNYTSPLSNTRYQWFGAIDKQIIVDELPKHSVVGNLGSEY